MLQQLPGYTQMAVTSGTNEGSQAAEAPPAAIRPAAEKDGYDLLMAFLSCIVQSCIIDRIAGIDIRTPFKKQPDYARMPVVSGHHKRRAIQLPGSRLQQLRLSIQ
jgi:hypothetical protein